MNDDIVKRLRDDYEKTVRLCGEAADEIERLRGALSAVDDDLKEGLKNAFIQVSEEESRRLRIKHAEEIERLRAELAAERAENKRLAKSRDRWGQRYNKVLGQLRAAVFTDTDYIKAVDEAAEKAIQERDAIRAELAAEKDRAERYRNVAATEIRNHSWDVAELTKQCDAAIAEVAKLREALDALLTEAEDVFVCMADATGVDRHNLPEPFRRACAVLEETGGNSEASQTN
jgi:chromosome segregation ATPase